MSEDKDQSFIGKDADINDLEEVYRKALAAFKGDKTNKDLRRAKSAAKKAWDEAVAATQEGEQLVCRDCSQKFMFNDHAFYERNGWFDKPSRCKNCSEKSKSRLADRKNRDSKTKNMCYAFQKGICGYGDQCKFSHDPKGKKKESDDDAENKKTETKEVSFVAICKWGSKCTLKKCRFSHPPNDKINEFCKLITQDPPVEEPQKKDSKKKSIAKAVTKALKKAPSKQLKMKELRKLIKQKMKEKNKEMSKQDLKDAISAAIAANMESIVEDGKIVRLIQ